MSIQAAQAVATRHENPYVKALNDSKVANDTYLITSAFSNQGELLPQQYAFGSEAGIFASLGNFISTLKSAASKGIFKGTGSSIDFFA